MNQYCCGDFNNYNCRLNKNRGGVKCYCSITSNLTKDTKSYSIKGQTMQICQRDTMNKETLHFLVQNAHRENCIFYGNLPKCNAQWMNFTHCSINPFVPIPLPALQSHHYHHNMQCHNLIFTGNHPNIGYVVWAMAATTFI